jgi:hypothetical protein
MNTLTNTPLVATNGLSLSRQFAICLSRVNRLVDRWVAASIARRAREVRPFGRAMPITRL